MCRILWLAVFAVFYVVNSEDCIPEPVEGLQLSVNGTLHWRPSTNCDDTSYIVYISFQNVMEHIYQISNTSLEVGFLPACEIHTFIVVAISNSFVSEGSYIDTPIPAEPDANLTVTEMRVIAQGNDAVLIEWQLDEQFAHCVQYYRVVHWDGETVPVDTYTTFANLVIDGLSPCTKFEFTVTPIYNDEMEGGIGLVEYETPAHNPHPPVLERVRPGTTYADMTWALPSYASNRCPISSIIVDGSPYINLTIPIEDSRQRPPVAVHVTPLQTESMYFFRVSMVNSGGASDAVPIAVQTLPASSKSVN